MILRLFGIAYSLIADRDPCVSILQALLNYERKSTSGWQIWNILLDFSGGSLSIIQLIGDSLAEARSQGLHTGWKGVLGNPAKLGLGMVSIFFDVSIHIFYSLALSGFLCISSLFV
jgi:hypothetical protein